MAVRVVLLKIRHADTCLHPLISPAGPADKPPCRHLEHGSSNHQCFVSCSSSGAEPGPPHGFLCAPCSTI